MTTTISPPPASLGGIYLPAGAGTPVGRFEFIVDPHTGSGVEIGTPIAADTTEGTVIGAVVDMRTVGTAPSPTAADLGASHASEALAEVHEVVVASVQVFWSATMRPVRAGRVRPATAAEMLMATGYERMDWAVPAGVVGLADGEFAKVCLDGKALLGPESAHLCIGGLSGQAAKTSFAGTLLRSAIHAGGLAGESVAAIIFNVKGEDLVYLDEPPAAGYELSAEDLEIYAALGVPASPFEDVAVYAPALPGGGGTRSPRPDATNLRWDLPQLWPFLKYFFPWMYEDEKLMSFFAEFEELCLKTKNPHQRVDTFTKLEQWFDNCIGEAMESGASTAWRSHHIATMRKLRRMLTALPSRGGGLFTKETARPGEDIPDTGWRHGQVLVVDIAGLPTDVQSVVIARTCDRLLKKAENGELGTSHLIVFADELNSFAPASGGDMAAVKKILQRLATQGRYAGISVWGAAQKLSKIDELVRDNCATRALGITTDGELASGIYGRLPGGLAERIATLPKGSMALWHYSFRSALVVRFPRPAWKTGKPKTTGAARPTALSVLKLSERAASRLTEGIPAEMAEEIVAGADDAELAKARLAEVRVPDMTKVALHEPLARVDPENPFDLS